MMRRPLQLLLAVLLALSHSADALQGSTQQPRRGREAYASLLYGDAFLLGLRVLGQSLRETGTSRDLLALVTGNVSQASLDTLRNDGWVVQEVEAVQNPGRWTQAASRRFPPRFWAVYTKLLVFNLTQYDTVVYLDADTIVTRNVDDLFLCDGLCGVMRHSERLNTGVMVLQPSEALFSDMMARIASTPSYTGGDQGFINSYFSDFPAAPFFDPRKGERLSALPGSWVSEAGVRIGRLPTLYNADSGLFVFNSGRWTLPEKEIRVLHYTLLAFKPWDWWTNWIMGQGIKPWQDLRSRLPPSSEGRLFGEDGRQQAARWVALPLPLLLAAFLVHRYLCPAGLCTYMRAAGGRLRRRVAAHSNGSSSPNGSGALLLSSGGVVTLCSGCAAVGAAPAEGSGLLPSLGSNGSNGSSGMALRAALPPPALGPAAITAGIACVLLSLAISTRVIIPSQVRPLYGWVMAYEWTSLLFVLLFAQFLRLCFRWGQQSAALGLLAGGAKADSSKPLCTGAQWPWGQSIWLFALVLSGLGLIPWWADIARVEEFATKVVLTAVSGVITALVCAQAFIELAVAWYQCGRASARQARCCSSKQLQV